MEGINYACLGLFLCPISLLIGVGVFFLIRFSSKKIITKQLGMEKAWISIPIAIILSVIVACVFFNSQFAPAFPGYYQPHKQPEREDIIGEWVVTDHTIEYLGELGYIDAAPTLILSSSGKFSTTDFPDILFFDRNLILHSGEGSWELVGNSTVQLIFDWIEPSWVPDPPLSGPTACPGLSVPCGGLEYSFSI